MIIFAISFRVELYQNSPLPPVEPAEPSLNVEAGAELEKNKLKNKAIRLISELDKKGTGDDKELMLQVEEMLKMEMKMKKPPKLEKSEMADKIVERITNPKQSGELPVDAKHVENRLSMQYEGAINEVIKEKIRAQLYSDDVVKRVKTNDYTIMPVEDWSLPLEKRKYKCIAREEKEVCNCASGSSSDFWAGQFLKIKDAKKLPPQPKKEVEI